MAITEIIQAVPATDMGLRIINAVFVGGDGETSPLMQAMSMFSTCMLTLGSLMLAWHTVLAMVATAHEGKPLGRWHVIWAPVRVSLGLALLIPAFNGATLGQVIVKELAIQSTTMASNVWATFSESMLTSKAEVPALETLGGTTLAKGLADKVFCAIQAADFAFEDRGTLHPVGDEMTPDGRHVIAWPTAAKIEDGKATLDFGAFCGQVIIPIQLANDVVTTQTKAWQEAQIQNAVTALNSIVSSGLVSKMYDSLKYTTSTELQAARPSREEWRAMIDTVAKEYDAQQREAAATLVNDTTASQSDHLLGAMNADGWIAAGTYWRDLSTRQRTFVNAAVGQIVIVPGTKNSGLNLFDPRATVTYDRIKSNYYPDEPVDRIAVARDFEDGAAQLDYVTQTGQGQTEASREVASRLASIAQAMQGVMETAAKSMTDPNADPIGAMSAFGHHLTLYGSEIGVASLVGAAAKSLPFLGSVLGGLADIGVKIGFFMIVVGSIYAYVLPNLPFIYMLFAAFGWCVLLMESLIAVILFAFSLIRMDGDELLGQSHRVAAMILLNFLIRPTLAVLALSSVYYLLPILLRVVNELVVPAFFISQGNAPVALVGACVGLLIVMFIHYQLVARSVSLITDLPDRIARWYGSQAEGLNETHHADAAKGVVAGAAISSGQKMSAEVSSKLGRRGPKQLEDPLADKGKSADAPRAST